jgi:site-specific recombinase XerD
VKLKRTACASPRLYSTWPLTDTSPYTVPTASTRWKLCIRHRLAALASLFQYLCNENAVTHNPIKGVKRPKVESGAGKTPAIGDHQARELLVAPKDDTVTGKTRPRDAIHFAVSCLAAG